MMTFPTPHSALRDAIARFEGGWQANQSDGGNWVHHPDGRMILIGTEKGVTPAAYAAFVGKHPWDVTAEEMKTAITLDVAADIGLKSYYYGPRFDWLTWCPLVEIAVDIGWGSGPPRGVRMLQELAGRLRADGAIGVQTQARFNAFVRDANMASKINALSDARVAFYRRISDPDSSDPKIAANFQFRAGWLRRANWYRPDNAEWWSQWQNWRPEALGARQADARPP